VKRALSVAAVAVVLVACLVASGCEKEGGSKGSAPAGRCHGVEFAEVRGTPPDYAGTTLRPYTAAPAVCAAYWLDHVADWFVPQGLAVRGSTAFVSGYRWHERRSERPCQLLVVDLETGRTREFLHRWAAPVYRPQPTYCRHGGGLELSRHGLWVAESERLWLLDPRRVGHGDPVVRVWRVQRPTEGSTVVVDRGRLGLAGFNSRRPARISWFRITDVLAPGVSVLATPDRGGRVPRRLQGIAAGRAGIWMSSSSTSCAELRAPGRRPVDFVPGAEDLQVVGEDVWALSEAGARPYLSHGEGVVPMLLRLDRRAVLAGRTADCGW
jgi:hypothetical protein